MKKIIFALLCVFFLVSVANADDRFIFMGMEQNGCEWFIDQYSISRDSQSGIISYWALQKLSTLYRKQIIENYYEKFNAREKRIAQQVTHLMIFQSINPKKATFRNNEVIFFDKRGTFFRTSKI